MFIHPEVSPTQQQQQPMINTALIGQSVTLIQIATEMQSSKQMSMALGLYMVALDKMMAALPCKFIYIFSTHTTYNNVKFGKASY